MGTRTPPLTATVIFVPDCTHIWKLPTPLRLTPLYTTPTTVRCIDVPAHAKPNCAER